MRFFLGTHLPSWLYHGQGGVDLFVSHRRLRERVSPYPPARSAWALDSGGYSELNDTGQWGTTPWEYVSAARRYKDELGRMVWAAPMDWMCEPWIVDKSGLSVDQHQGRTVENFCLLRQMAPDVPWIPVLQGWGIADYHRCVDLYDRAGVKLWAEPTVGVGSVCRRQGTSEIEAILTSLAALGLRLHGFGVKTDGLARYAHALTSADSLAWSYAARRQFRTHGPDPTCYHGPKTGCQNCPRYALRWRSRLLTEIPPQQLSLGVPA